MLTINVNESDLKQTRSIIVDAVVHAQGTPSVMIVCKTSLCRNDVLLIIFIPVLISIEVYTCGYIRMHCIVYDTSCGCLINRSVI